MEEGVQRAFLRHTSKDYLKRGKQMNKKVSVLLSFLMIFTMLFAAQLPAAALPAGTVIYVNTYDAGWDNAYIYGWDCGLKGEFVQMEKTPHQGIYSFALPQQSPDGMIYFYFSDRNTWDGQERTESLSTQTGKNFYTIYDKDDYGKWTGRWSFVAPIEPTEPIEPPTEPPTVPPTQPPTQPPVEYPEVVEQEGHKIFFDNTELKWDNVYICGYKDGYYAGFLEMRESSIPGIYTYTLPNDGYWKYSNLYFISKPDVHDGVMVGFALQESANIFVPSVTAQGHLTGAWQYISPPQSIPFVSSTLPGTFGEMMVLQLYTNCFDAEYSINGAVPVAYTDGTNIEITDTVTIELTGYDVMGDLAAASTYTYTKVGYTTIHATVTGYDGEIYAYLFGGIRGGYHYNMVKLSDGSYSFTFEGDARVFFTTTNDWATAIKFNQEEYFIPAGSTQYFELAYPPA